MSTDSRTFQPDARFGAVLKSLSLAGSVCVAVAGGLILLGWVLENETLKSLFHGPLTIKVNTAVALILAGLSLWLALGESVTPWLRAAQRAAAIAVGLIGATTVTQDITGVNLGLDQLLFSEAGAAFETGSPGRMSPNTAVLLVLCGVALWRLTRHPREDVHPAQVPATLACGLAFLGILGHAYGASHLVRVDSYTQMALPMAVILVVLSLSILFARPASGVMAILTDGGSAGVLVRRSLPVAILGPPIFGWLGLLGERAGLYEAGFGAILVAVANITALTLTVGGIVRAFIRTDVQRQVVEAERLRLDQLLRDRNRELEEAGRALDAQFRHANKMDAIGQLAAGVAHDFNNLLTVILGFSELLASESKLTPADLRDMTEIIKAARRAAELTKQLLAFSRQQPPHSTALDMNALVTDMSGMLDRLIGQHITVTLALSPELPEVIADRGQMEQVVMNLVVNARDAMDAGGTIAIETAVIDMPDTVVGESLLPEGRYVRLAISDTGAGMSAETLAHLFDPFFTTKAVGKGTGLGLSTVAGIILQVKGHIRVDSVVARGTTFTVYVPVSTQGTLELPVEVEAAVTAPDAPGTILLVDDDAALRRLATRILTGAGYRVVEAANSHDAEQLFAHEAGRVALLVTDVMMPVVSGPDLWKRLQQRAPELPVVFMSSYLSAQRRQNLGVGGAFVQKPFSASDFARAVETALGRTT